MDGRENEIILVEQRRSGFIRRRRRRIEREVGQELLACAIARGDLFELREIRRTRRRIVVQAFEVRLIPAAHLLKLGRPRRGAAEQRLEQRDEPFPLGTRTRRYVGDEPLRRIGRRKPVENLCCTRRSDPRHKLCHAKADRKSTRLNSSHPSISYAVFCLKKKTGMNQMAMAPAS